MKYKTIEAPSKKAAPPNYALIKTEWIKNIVIRVGLVLWIIMSPVGKKEKASPPTALGSVISDENVSFSLNELKKSDWHLNWPGITHTFLEKNPETGDTEFSPWGLIAPVQLEVSRTMEEEKKVDITIPYEYAELFNSAKEINPGDKQKVINYIDQELKKIFADDLIGLKWSKRVYRVDHSTILKGLKVKSLTIKGTTSPEGPKEHGPDAIKPGNISRENMGLGEKRAKDVYPITMEYLESQGISAESLGLAERNITFEEIQFTNHDFATMERIAEKLGITGFDIFDKTHNLIIDYNDKKITDPEALAHLDSIIAIKRSVKVHIKFEGEYDETLLIPIPIFLLLPLLRRRRKKGNKCKYRYGNKGILPIDEETTIFPADDEKTVIPVDEEKTIVPANEETTIVPADDEKTVIPVDEEKTIIPADDETTLVPADEEKTIIPIDKEKMIVPTDEDMSSTEEDIIFFADEETPPETSEIPRMDKDQILENIPEGVLITELSPSDSQEYKAMQELSIIDDIYKYINDPERIENGIDYRLRILQMEAQYHEFKNDQEREYVITILLLEDWEKHDKAIIKKAGMKDIETGQDYKNDPEQIKWAKIHAREILDMIKQKKEAKNEQISYDEILEKKYLTMLRRRLMESNS